MAAYESPVCRLLLSVLQVGSLAARVRAAKPSNQRPAMGVQSYYERESALIVLAIDPGTSTGWARWDARHFQLLEVTSMPIHEAMWRVVQERPEFVICEDARLRRWFGKADKDEEKYGSARREGAGYAKRDATIWDDFLTAMAIPHEMRKPVDTKMKAPEFQRLTKWTGPTNHNARDAAMIVFQLNLPILRAKYSLALAQTKKATFPPTRTAA